MQALSRSIDTVLIKYEGITKLAENINSVFHKKKNKKQSLKVNEEISNKINSSYYKISKTDVHLIEENTVE